MSDRLRSSWIEITKHDPQLQSNYTNIKSFVWIVFESDLEGKVGGQDGLVLEEEQQAGAALQGDLHQVEAVQATPKGILQQK